MSQMIAVRDKNNCGKWISREEYIKNPNKYNPTDSKNVGTCFKTMRKRRSLF